MVPPIDEDAVTLIVERQRQMLKRLDDLEKKHIEMERMMNRFVGGTALLVGVGVFVGWMFTIGSGYISIFAK